MKPKVAPVGPVTDEVQYRQQFADGRVGSDPSLATAEDGERLIATADKSIAQEVEDFFGF